ncbi:MAG: DNA primase [Bacteroidetes bacterium]|nr:DNA primase [Bacteroidota bacterium]
MIPKQTVDKIIDAAHVEDVVGEFVTLKKRGANLLGLCPFHGEKTPSFTVSPVKGIYKCFGCGKAGNSVNFIMEHLQLSYPEALKWLAKKYNIEVVEREITPEEREQQTERESMMIVMQYAQRYFSDTMHNSDEGKSIGLGYFVERGLRADIIEKFQLGYSLEERNAFSNAAIKNGYQPKYLVKTGMSILSNRYVEGNEIIAQDIFDRYAGRVMFPIHDDGGRVVAFGGRTLSSDKKTAKYINSPETEIYNKSKILYGLWLGKKSIQNKDTCFLVEGYMDVIAMHQAGIENVVASSGTSLTIEQIKSIHRFTRNIVVLYDGDEAGQKASNRAIPLLLEEGMNVRLLQFPNNDDPDSFSRKVSTEEFQTYIENNTSDFLYFKAKKLKDETKNDPIKRATVIKDIVENISLIPDNIIRSIYIKECANIMEMEETVLQTEVNKLRRKASGKQQKVSNDTPPDDFVPPEYAGEQGISQEQTIEEDIFKFEREERDLLKLILNYGGLIVVTHAEDEDSNKHEVEITLAEFVFMELERDDIKFENPIHQTVLDEYVHELSENRLPAVQHFLMHQNPVISTFAVNNAITNHTLSPHWEKRFSILVPDEIHEAKKNAEKILFSLKARILQSYKKEKDELLRTSSSEIIDELLVEIKKLNALIERVSKLLGRVVIR